MPGFDPITSVLNIGNSLIDRLLPDKAANDAAKAQLLQLQVSGELAQVAAQIQVNQTEASNPNLFVAGWRPFCGWIAGSGLAVQFLVAPLFTWVATLWGHPVQFPTLDMGTLMTLLLGMLGLGGMRTFEKVSGVSDSHPLK